MKKILLSAFVIMSALAMTNISTFAHHGGHRNNHHNNYNSSNYHNNCNYNNCYYNSATCPRTNHVQYHNGISHVNSCIMLARSQ